MYFLRAQGYDVVGVSETMPQASDFDILQRAVAEQRVIITNDKDFGDMVFRDQRRHLGILLLRLADDRTEAKIQVIAAVLAHYAGYLEKRFVVATEQNIRLRPPL